MLQIVTDWCDHLRTRLHWGEDDPLFPKTKMGLAASGAFQADGLARKHWSGTGAIRALYQQAFAAAGLPYFNPHYFRDTLTGLGMRICRTAEDFKAGSQNLGHERVLTTFTSYGRVSSTKQAELIRGLGEVEAIPAIDPALNAQVLAALQHANGAGTP